MRGEKKQVNIRCSVEEKAILDGLVDKSNKSANQYVIDLWTEEYNRRKAENDSDEEKKDSKEDSSMISVLVSQLEQKDEQIRMLQKIVDQEQQLHLREKREQIMIEENTRKGKWWKFWEE